MTKLKFGKIPSHFSTSQPYFTMNMTTDLDGILHGATHVSREPTFTILYKSVRVKGGFDS